MTTTPTRPATHTPNDHGTLQVSVTRLPDRFRVALCGDASFTQAQHLEAQLTPVLAARLPVEVDLSQLAGISSLVLGTLVGLNKCCRRRGVPVTFTGAAEPLTAAVRRARLEDVLTFA